MREELKVSSEEQPETHTFHVRFDEWGGWGVFVLIPSLGMLMIRSDWGEAGHRWTPQPTLEGFAKELLRFSPNYIIGKFAYEKKDDWEPVVNPAKTRRYMLESLAENADIPSTFHKEEREEAAEKYRELVEEIISFCGNLDDYSRSSHSVSVALHEASSELWNAFGSELYEFIRYNRSARYKFWEDTLIPWFQDYLRTRVL
jgi:hypothetical protein